MPTTLERIKWVLNQDSKDKEHGLSMATIADIIAEHELPIDEKWIHSIPYDVEQQTIHNGNCFVGPLVIEDIAYQPKVFRILRDKRLDTNITTRGDLLDLLHLLGVEKNA